MKIFTFIIIGVILINMFWIWYLLKRNSQLEDEIQEERKKAIKEINKLRKKD